MSSNVAQNYPYSSEPEAERRAALDRAMEAFEGLRERVATESTPLGAPESDARWWVWVCPEHDFTGRLHVAGYPLERHGIYTVCDTCGKSFLR